MKTTTKQRQRIIENIFDILIQSDFEDQARKEMKKDLKNKNVSVDPQKGTIEIQNENGTITQYTIAIFKNLKIINK